MSDLVCEPGCRGAARSGGHYVQATLMQGFTLVEVMVSLFLLSVVSLSLTRALVSYRALGYAHAQHVSAFGVARAKLEEVRALPYSDIQASALPTEHNYPFAHLSGAERKPLVCRVRTTVRERTSPERKWVRVRVDWTSRGRRQLVEINTNLYPR